MQTLSQVKCPYTLSAKTAVRRPTRRPTAPANGKEFDPSEVLAARRQIRGIRGFARGGRAQVT